MITRRFFSQGLIAAPAVILTPGLLMPLRGLTMSRQILVDEISWTEAGVRKIRYIRYHQDNNELVYFDVPTLNVYSINGETNG